MKENVLIATYGTLLPGCGGVEHLKIADKLRPVRSDFLKGMIWLRRDNNEDSLIVPGYVPGEKGEVYSFIYETDPETISLIDNWEGVEDGDYVREKVKTKSGLETFVYVCSAPEKRTSYLRDGDWRLFAAHPKARVLFHSDYKLPFKN